MWKDFFYFSKGQRVGIIVLLLLIFLVLAINFSLPFFFPVNNPKGTSFFAKVEDFKRTLVERDSLRSAKWRAEFEKRQHEYEERYKNFNKYPNKNESVYQLFKFNPNLADSATFVQLGIKPYIAANIMKYKKKGGKFKNATDFTKVYGITPDKFKELAPYITIPEIEIAKIDSSLLKKKILKQDIIVDINTADTTILMQVRGLGRGYAKGIVRYRQQLGGFVSVNQLNEINGMRPENLEKIRPFCNVNSELVQKIRINIASVERLNAHPYISFYQAKAIYELRRYKGKLSDINDLKELEELKPDDLNKIKPYLSFE